MIATSVRIASGNDPRVAVAVLHQMMVPYQLSGRLFGGTCRAAHFFDLTQFMAKLREAGPVRVAFLIDACRDNPLTFDETVDLMRGLREPRPTASATVPTRGLARVELSLVQAGGRHSAETLVFFSAQPGAKPQR